MTASGCCEALLANLTWSSSPAWTQPGPINADDGHVSGDLDRGRSLRLQTRTPSRALEALVDPDVPLTPNGDHPKDPFAVRRAQVALRAVLLLIPGAPPAVVAMNALLLQHEAADEQWDVLLAVQPPPCHVTLPQHCGHLAAGLTGGGGMWTAPQRGAVYLPHQPARPGARRQDGARKGR